MTSFIDKIAKEYDLKPLTAEYMVEALENIVRATRSEYARGWREGREDLRKERAEEEEA